jgi:hypothetical protein
VAVEGRMTPRIEIRDGLVLVGDEAWTPDDLVYAIRNPTCPGFHPSAPDPRWRDIARAVLAIPATPRRAGAALRAIAQQYGVTLRTVQRYRVRYEKESLPCPGDHCMTLTPAGRLCSFCRRTVELERAA